MTDSLSFQRELLRIFSYFYQFQRSCWRAAILVSQKANFS